MLTGETLDEAVHSLAKKISARLAPADAPRVTARNLSSISTAELTRARTTFEQGLRRSHSRTPQPVEIALTISENLQGYLLIAELQRGDERIVEISQFQPDPVARASRVLLESRLIFEQESPILDIALSGDRMLILEPSSVGLRAQRGPRWEHLDARPLASIPVVRDPRGKLIVSDAAFTAYLPGSTCRGDWTPALEVHCEAGSAEFMLNGVTVKFTPARNTLEMFGRPASFSYALVQDRSGVIYAVAETDGRTHIFNTLNEPTGIVENVGADFIIAENGCGAGSELLLTSNSDRSANDTIVDYEMIDRKPVRTSDPIEFGGPVTALWPFKGGALAVVHNLASGKYAAYQIAIACSD